MTEPAGFVVPRGSILHGLLFKKKEKYRTKNPTKIDLKPKLLTEQKAKLYIAVMETKLAQLKEQQTTINLPSDLVENTIFPNIKSDYKTRLEQCTFLRSYLADIRRQEIQNKVRACMRAIKRI
jgi:hypothetical protein